MPPAAVPFLLGVCIGMIGGVAFALAIHPPPECECERESFAADEPMAAVLPVALVSAEIKNPAIFIDPPAG